MKNCNHFFGKYLSSCPIRTIVGRCLFSLALILISTADVVYESGDLQSYIGLKPIPGSSSSNKFRLPTAAESVAFEAMLNHVLAGELTEAAEVGVLANYEVVSYLDTVSSDTFTLLREIESNQHWGGTYIIDQTPERALVIESPHPLYDGVKQPALDIFFSTDAVAFMQSGTHRNNSDIETSCDGTLSGEPYRISDVAHSPESLFQKAHEVIEAYYDNTVSISYHGMAGTASPSDVIVSNGTTHDFEGVSLSKNMADRMNAILSGLQDSRYASSHQQHGISLILSGNSNTQGRVANGSYEPCNTSAATAIFPEQFLHIESDGDVRSGDATNWAFQIQSINDLIPLFSETPQELPTGNITISEFMADPVQLSDGAGEYVELFNHTNNEIDMTGWKLADRGGNIASISGVIAPGDVIVIGGSADLNGDDADGGPADADVVWTHIEGYLSITNTGDVISVLDENDYLVASVAYDDDDIVPGYSLEIIQGNDHDNGQTSIDDYQLSETALGSDFGSPGTRGGSLFPIDKTSLSMARDSTAVSIEFASSKAVKYKLFDGDDLSNWKESYSLPSLFGDGEIKSFTFPSSGFEREFFRLEMSYEFSE